jgi:predicted anti-sigma-YlaC factor YlaD
VKLSHVFPAALLLGLLALPGCSLRRLAVNKLGDALAQGSPVYAKDDDPELVAQAIPFGLKTVEALLEESPHHRGLLLAAASGFTQYAYVFVQQDADFAEAADLARATALRDRARRLYLRARDYGLRGLEVDFPGFRERLRRDPKAAAAPLRGRHVPLLYWTASAWGAAISISKADAELTADQFVVDALMQRALALDEGWEHGTLHDFYVSFDGGRPASAGGSAERARQHLERARALSRDRRVWPIVTFAETVSVGAQDRREFASLLQQALAIDPGALPEARLANLVAQRRARWLLAREDELFVE